MMHTRKVGSNSQASIIRLSCFAFTAGSFTNSHELMKFAGDDFAFQSRTLYDSDYIWIM